MKKIFTSFFLFCLCAVSVSAQELFSTDFSTEDDFLAMDFESYYERALSADLWLKDVKELNDLAKAGNTEANLVLLIMLKERFLSEGKRRALLSNVSRLYSVHNERKASFLFAQMLRIDDIGNNKNLIKNLLEEAYELGIGGE